MNNKVENPFLRQEMARQQARLDRSGAYMSWLDLVPEHDELVEELLADFAGFLPQDADRADNWPEGLKGVAGFIDEIHEQLPDIAAFWINDDWQSNSLTRVCDDAPGVEYQINDIDRGLSVIGFRVQGVEGNSRSFLGGNAIGYQMGNEYWMLVMHELKNEQGVVARELSLIRTPDQSSAVAWLGRSGGDKGMRIKKVYDKNSTLLGLDILGSEDNVRWSVSGVYSDWERLAHGQSECSKVVVGNEGGNRVEGYLLCSRSCRERAKFTIRLVSGDKKTVRLLYLEGGAGEVVDDELFRVKGVKNELPISVRSLINLVQGNDGVVVALSMLNITMAYNQKKSGWVLTQENGSNSNQTRRELEGIKVDDGNQRRQRRYITADGYWLVLDRVDGMWLIMGGGKQENPEWTRERVTTLPVRADC